MILVVEDDSTTSAHISRILTDRNYSVDSVSTGEEALATFNRKKHSLILMDIFLPGAYDGIEVARKITTSVPVPVLFISTGDDEELLDRLRATGGAGFIKKPFDARELIISVELALVAHHSQTTAHTLCPEELPGLVVEVNSDGIITWTNKSDEWFTQEIGLPSSPVFEHIAILAHDSEKNMLYNHIDHIRNEQNRYSHYIRFHAAASDEKWFEMHSHNRFNESGNYTGSTIILYDATNNVLKQNELTYYAYTDQLTGLPNRRVGYMMLEKELHRSRRNKSYLSVLMADIDGLKLVNDTLGHSAGDTHIYRAATVLDSSLRESDCVMRIGGDEFIILLPDSGPDGASKYISRVLQNIEQDNRNNPHQKPLHISLGYSIYAPGDTRTAGDLLDEADHKMYIAKKGEARYSEHLLRA